MIYTVTLSPALDYMMWLDHFKEGDLNRAGKTSFRAGGKGINVSVVLNRLGLSSVCLGFTAGFTGKELIRLLEAEGVRHDFIEVKGGCTRINVKIKSETESEINASGPTPTREDLEVLVKKAGALTAGDILILSGKPPKGIPDDIYALMMDAVSDDQVRTVVDTSGIHLAVALEKHPFLIKPNLAELEEISGRELPTTEAIARAAADLRQRGAENVLVSLGEKGGLLAADDGRIYMCGVPEGKLINSTGAGDSMAAGFVARDLSGADRADCLRFAAACGSASAYTYDLLEPEELNRVYSRTPVPGILFLKRHNGKPVFWEKNSEYDSVKK